MRYGMAKHTHTLDEAIETIEGMRQYSHIKDTDIFEKFSNVEVYGIGVPFLGIGGEAQEISPSQALAEKLRGSEAREVFYVNHYNIHTFENWIVKTFGFICAICEKVSFINGTQELLSADRVMCPECAEETRKFLKVKYKDSADGILNDAKTAEWVRLKAVTRAINKMKKAMTDGVRQEGLFRRI